MYLQWEQQTDSILKYYKYPEEEAVQLVTINFTDIAQSCWMLDYSDREYNMISTIATREELKEAMHAHFVHFDYDQRVQQRLDHLRQGSRSPNEHYSEMRKLMHKIGMRYPDKIILSKFITSLNRDIGEQVEHK